MTRRGAGICLPLTALPGPNGIGELGVHARQFVDSLAAMSVHTWQILPLGPTAYGNSPYQPLSAFAGNPLLIDLDQLVQSGWVEVDELEPFSRLPTGHVDYGSLIPLKMAVLRRAAHRFRSSRSQAQARDFDSFVARHDPLWLNEYARYQVLKDQHDQLAWHEWDPAYRAREKPALAALDNSHHHELQVVRILQYWFFSQWQDLRRHASSRGVALFGDVPIYIALDSAEAWSRPDLLQLDEDRNPTHVAGVPPDYFSADGQRWGNPLYNWEVHAAEDYQWWHARLRHAVELHDLVRLDHFRAFESYWAVPASSETARDGRWRRGPGYQLFSSLEATWGKLPIIAEDLGMITEKVDQLRQQCGFPGMKVLQFMIEDETFDPDAISPDTVCYTGTHDNDTIMGWYHGSSTQPLTPAQLDFRQHRARVASRSPAERVAEGLIRLALSTRSELAIIPLQDLLGLGSPARMNTPGTTDGNWEWRLREGELGESARAAMAAWVHEADRQHGHGKQSNSTSA